MRQGILLALATAAFALAQNTPAENGIAEARKAMAGAPGQAVGYTRFAMACLRRARETGDSVWVAQAAAAAKKALEISPGDLQAEEARGAVLLAQHDYVATLAAAQALNKRNADDVPIYGLLADANRELGNYPEAIDAAQWMLNLRPGNLPAFIKSANLRDVYGDPEGAYEYLELALQSTPATETEERAWLLAQMAHVKLAGGDSKAAGKLLDQSMAAFPNYYIAQAGLAEVSVAEKRYEEAVAQLQKLCESVPRAATLYALAEAQRLAGHEAAARKAFADFETKAQEESHEKDNANRQLILYYAGYGQQPAKALDLAKQESAWRHDIYTLDAYAWALHANGQDAEARKQLQVALAINTRDHEILRHARELGMKTEGQVSAGTTQSR